MFPPVTTVGEPDRILERVRGIAAALEDEGQTSAMLELGAVIETLASAFVSRELAERVDFLGVGTSDLTQYVMATDRGDGRVTRLHDPRCLSIARAR